MQRTLIESSAAAMTWPPVPQPPDDPPTPGPNDNQ